MLGALSAPLRPRIVRNFSGSWRSSPTPAAGSARTAQVLPDPPLPRLREADATRQHQYGLEHRSHVRAADLNARFPDLMDLVAAWTPPEAD